MKKNRLIYGILCCLLGCWQSVLVAEDEVWKTLSMPIVGDEVSRFYSSQLESNVVYAVTSDQLLKSEDGGENWSLVKREGEHDFYIHDLVIADSDQNTMLTVSSGQVKKSTDGGQHWVHIAQDYIAKNLHISRLNPVSQATINLVVSKKETNDTQQPPILISSNDLGETWTELNDFSLLNNDSVFQVIPQATNPDNLSIIYGCAEDRLESCVLYKSVDQGVSWSAISPDTTTGYYKGSLYIHPLDHNLLFGLFFLDLGGEVWHYSRDAGLSWEPIESAEKLIIDPNTIGRVYSVSGTTPPDSEDYLSQDLLVTSEVKLSVSNDFGTSWQLIPTEIVDRHQYSRFSRDFLSADYMVYNHQQTLFRDGAFLWSVAGTTYKSTLNDAEQSFKAVNIEKRISGSLYSLQSHSDIFYLEDALQLYRSDDNGQHWKSLFNTSDMVYPDCKKMLVYPDQPLHLLCQTDSRLYESTTGGETWTMLYQDKQQINNIALSVDGKALYLISNDGLYLSLDKGRTFKAMYQSELCSAHCPPRQLLIDPELPNVLYTIDSIPHLNGRYTVYKSADHGQSWNELQDVATDDALFLIHPVYSNRLLFIAGQRLLLSDDGGTSWISLDQSISATFDSTDPETASFEQIVFNPKNRDGLIKRSVDGIYQSDDLGQTWKPVYAGQTSDLQVINQDVFINSDEGIKQLNQPAFSTFSNTSKNCLFNWAETTYPQLFAGSGSDSLLTDHYIYRYYDQSHSYLGFYQDNKVHVYFPNQTGDIDEVGLLEDYLRLSGCDS